MISHWRPYDRRDHARHFFGTLITASNDLCSSLPVASWAHDTTTAEIRLLPSDIVIAATDGFFDTVHMMGAAGRDTRQFVRDAYLEEQLDPGQLAERLLLRAWKTVQVRCALCSCNALDSCQTCVVSPHSASWLVLEPAHVVSAADMLA